MSKKHRCCCRPLSVSIGFPREARVAGAEFSVYGDVRGKDVDDLSAWLQFASGDKFYGAQILQALDPYDWGFHFSNAPLAQAFKLIVQAVDLEGNVARDTTHGVCLAFAAAVTVAISFPPNSPPSVPGAYFETAGWVSDINAVRTAKLVRNGVKIKDGVAIPQGAGSLYDWKFSFTGVPLSNPLDANDTTLEVRAHPQVGADGVTQRLLNIAVAQALA
jgi:hypothetical protein